MKRMINFCFVVIIFVIVISVGPNVVYAEYYNTYSTVATIPNGNRCNRTQGFAVGSSYVYTAKCNDNESKQVIYRTKISDGTTTLMTNGDNSNTYTTYLGHANDMDTCTINGNYHLFVATMKTGSESLVKLSYSGNTYTKVGHYSIKNGDENLSISGVKKYNKDSNYIYFLFFKCSSEPGDVSVYRGKIGLTLNSGTINVTHAFDINVTNALVNGNTVSDLNNFSRQGIGYIASTDQLLVPLTKNNVSIILVYDNASTAAGIVYANPNLSFRITSSAYSNLFEIEGCDETNGRVYFNCNRKGSSSDINHDAVCYFKDFSVF